MKNRANQSRSRRSNAVLRTLLAGISHPSAFNSAFLYFLFIKPELRITFHFRQRLAVKSYLRPGNNLGISVLSKHERRKAAGIKARLFRYRVNQTGRIKKRPRTHDMPLRQAALTGDQIRHHVTGIRNAHKKSVESSGHDLRDIIGHLFHTVFQFPVAAAGSAKRDIAYSIHDDIAVFQPRIIGRLVNDMIRHVHDRIIQILYLACHLAFFQIAKKHFIGNPHHPQIKRYMGTYMSYTDNPYHSLLNCHNAPSIPSTGTVPDGRVRKRTSLPSRKEICP